MNQFERYSRQVPMDEIGTQGQIKLATSSALVIGAGGLGSTLLYCLAGAGVGTIAFMDGDVVSLSNLNRQFLHFERDIDKPKVDSAAEKLRAFNSTLRYIPIHDIITEENAEQYIKDYDVIILAVDSALPRFIVNDVCCRLGKPLVNGGVDGMDGMVHAILPGQTPCLRCIYGGPHKTSRHPASFAPIVSTISAQESLLAIQILLGNTPESLGKLIYFNGNDLSWNTMELMRAPGCPACGTL
jgi:molybdopterin/thiamine biosynthesis adenylyltransferase